MAESPEKAKLDVVSVTTLIFGCIETGLFKCLSLYYLVCVVDRLVFF